MKVGLHAACLIRCYSAPGCCWRGSGEVKPRLQHVEVCGEFEKNGARKRVLRGYTFLCPCAGGGDGF